MPIKTRKRTTLIAKAKAAKAKAAIAKILTIEVRTKKTRTGTTPIAKAKMTDPQAPSLPFLPTATTGTTAIMTSLLLPAVLTGVHLVQLVPSRIKAAAVHAGLSALTLNLKVFTKSSTVPFTTCLNNNSLTVPHKATMAAMVAS